MSRPWMPLYVADYLADTRRLTLAEHGAYMLLIMEYWRNGGLPDDDAKLARIIGATASEWGAIRDNIAEFFQPGWRHKRIDHELAQSAGKSAAARASAEKRWKKDANAMPTQCEGNANAYADAMLSQPQSHISSSLRSDDKRAERAPTPKEILAECLSDETATELVAHRKAMKAPLTAGSAKGLVKQFRDYGDAEAAARAMMARGWRGFNADWMRQDTRAGPKPSRGGGWESLLTTNFGADDEPRSEEKRIGEVIPVLPFREGEGRGGGNDDGGGVSRNAVELLVAGSFRRM